MSSKDFRQKWLSIVGIGEDGLDGLNSVGRSLVQQAQVIIGGDRQLAMVPEAAKEETPKKENPERLRWTSPIADSVEEIICRRGQAVCVLASGDPMCYGIGVTLARVIPLAEMTIVPAPSAFSLACARLGWSLTEIETLSLCGRDPALLKAVLYPGAQLLVLSSDRHTPPFVAQLLTQQGLGTSQMTVLERLGGSQERLIAGTASTWQATDLADLNTIAITCIADPPLYFQSFSHFPGLPDSAYHNDGQLTKREVRAVTLSALAPFPKQLLWDIGAGCGSIAIEWLRSDRRCQAIAIEQHQTRLQYIADNAAALGVPHLKLVAGSAPLALKDLPQPDAIFIGGGVTTPDLLATCWQALRSGGRLVVNAVTVESEQVLFQGQQQWGGELTRIGIQRAEAIGKFLGWKALATVTQWVVVKG